MRDDKNIEELCRLDIDYIGFIFYPQSPRYVDKKPAISIPRSIEKVGVFVNSNLQQIEEKIKDFDLQVVQLHGKETPNFCHEVKELGVKTFKAFGIDESFQWTEVQDYIDQVDYFLFDTKSKQYGGTGKSFNWQILTEYPWHTPYFLSGGISPQNLNEAVDFKDGRLYGLDLNSKFEISPGLKNIELLTQAFSKIK